MELGSRGYVEGLLARYGGLPRFPDGRVDFSTSDSAPVLNIFIMHGEEVLLFKRSGRVGAYKGLWNGIGGYIDEPVPLHDKTLAELHEETGIDASAVQEVSFAPPFEVIDEGIPKTWLVHPALVVLKERIEPALDWEHTDFRWVVFGRFGGFRTAKGFLEAAERIARLTASHPSP